MVHGIFDPPTRNKPQTKKQTGGGSAGFSMLELLIALAIIGVMILFLTIGQNLNVSRGEDAVRKNDLSRLKIVFEDYYNDHGCYPPPELLTNCYSSDLSPYLSRVPCDPRTRKPYAYYRDEQCKWYAVFAHLEDGNDTAITDLQCSPNCGIEDGTANYFVSNNAYSSQEIRSSVNSQTNYTPATPAPDTFYACDQSGICNIYASRSAHSCPVTYTDELSCEAGCQVPANRCAY